MAGFMAKNQVSSSMRNSSIELLRIFAACGVVVLHYNGMFGALDSSDGIVLDFLMVLESLFICAVDLFVIISGFFLCTSLKRTWGKPVYLFLLLSIVNVGAYILKATISDNPISIMTIIHTMIPPRNYFVLLYVTIYILSPFINILLNKLTNIGRTLFIIVLFVLFSLYPTLMDSYQILIHSNVMGISTVGMYGQQHGYTIIGFVLCYSIGAWMRLNKVLESFSVGYLLTVFVFDVALIYVWFRTEWTVVLPESSLEEYNALSYTNPLVLFSASLLMLLFLRINLKSRLINSLSKSSFVCFILHLQLLPYFKVTDVALNGGWSLCLHLCLSVAGLYLLSWAVWRVLDYVLNPITKWLNTVSIYNLDRYLVTQPD